jgi:hypothetical protein
MRLESRTYPIASSRCSNAVDLWTLGSVANSLKNRSLPSIRSSNNEDSELDIVRVLGANFLSVHGTNIVRRGLNARGAAGDRDVRPNIRPNFNIPGTVTVAQTRYKQQLALHLHPEGSWVMTRGTLHI